MVRSLHSPRGEDFQKSYIGTGVQRRTQVFDPSEGAEAGARPQKYPRCPIVAALAPTPFPHTTAPDPPDISAPFKATLVLRCEGVESGSVAMRWGFKGSAPMVGSFKLLVAEELGIPTNWRVLKELQYGEFVCNVQMSMGLHYHFMAIAVSAKDEAEGWASNSCHVKVPRGEPAGPTKVRLRSEGLGVALSWDPPGAELVHILQGYRVYRVSDGNMLAEFPTSTCTAAWPRSVAGNQLAVTSLSLEGRESHWAYSSELPGPRGPLPKPPEPVESEGEPTVELVAGAYRVDWVQTLPAWSFVVLVKDVSGERRGRVRRFPAAAPPLELPHVMADTYVKCAVETHGVGGTRHSKWSRRVLMVAPAPSAPGKPCVRRENKDLCFTWMPPYQGSRDLTYTMLIDSDDGRGAEISTGESAGWCVPVDELAQHFFGVSLRFAVTAQNSVGSSPPSPWSEKIKLAGFADYDRAKQKQKWDEKLRAKKYETGRSQALHQRGTAATGAKRGKPGDVEETKADASPRRARSPHPRPQLETPDRRDATARSLSPEKVIPRVPVPGWSPTKDWSAVKTPTKRAWGAPPPPQKPVLDARRVHSKGGDARGVRV